jgi:hypothetical protein
VTTVRAIRTETAPLHGYVTRLAEQALTTADIQPAKQDWTKLDAYLPRTNVTSLSVEMNAAINATGLASTINTCTAFAGGGTVSFPLGTGGNMRLLKRLSLFDKGTMVVLDEAHHTTTLGNFSIICNGIRADIEPNIVSWWYKNNGVVDIPTSDPLASYEMYQIANWDGEGAEPITAQTIAYARRIIAVLPKSLGAPDIAPAGDGSIALEWVPGDPKHKLDRLFLDIGPGEQWRAYWTLRTGEFRRIPQTGFSEGTKKLLADLFRDLSA